MDTGEKPQSLPLSSKKKTYERGANGISVVVGLIIGGGGVAGGMKAAAKARRESPAMKITVVTDEEYISYAGCGMPYFIGDIIKDSKKLLVREPLYFKNMHNIDILTRHQATAVDIKSKQVKVKNLENGQDLIFNYDKLILATGAQPILPPLPGISLDNIFTLRTINVAVKIKSFVDSGKVKHAVIVGGGLIGLEMAENLVLRVSRQQLLSFSIKSYPLWTRIWRYSSSII